MEMMEMMKTMKMKMIRLFRKDECHSLHHDRFPPPPVQKFTQVIKASCQVEAEIVLLSTSLCLLVSLNLVSDVGKVRG